jgi:DNA polymerase III alpha subunit
MITDKFGQPIFSEKDICDLYMSDPSRQLKSLFVKEKISFDLELNLQTLPELFNYEVSDQTIEEFDQSRAYEWFMPQEYKNLDIAKWVLDQCKTDAELQRAGEELIMFQERNMFILLQYLKYLVDTMRENNIVWGVGRGSSIASFVLYLIGIHRINSLYYDLSINEFLK